MTKPSSKTFDAVQSMRQIRDDLSAEIADMSYAELVHWLRAHQDRDAFCKEWQGRLPSKPTQRPDLRPAADRPSPAALREE